MEWLQLFMKAQSQACNMNFQPDLCWLLMFIQILDQQSFPFHQQKYGRSTWGHQHSHPKLKAKI